MGAKSEKIFKDIQFVHSNHEMDMLKKNRQDCEHPKNAQFNIYATTWNSFNKFWWNFAKKFITM